MTAQTLRCYLRDELGLDVERLDDATPLFTTGVFDSFAMVQIVTFVEQVTGARVHAKDITPENFDTIARIVAYTSRRREAEG